VRESFTSWELKSPVIKMNHHLCLLLMAVFVVSTCGCSSQKDDGYLSPPSDPQTAEQVAQKAKHELATSTYASVGKPFGCDTDCRDEELGFAEARQDGVTKSEDCTTRFSDKSLMTNATQDGCRAYVQTLSQEVERQVVSRSLE
jgi:hypothetical protein